MKQPAIKPMRCAIYTRKSTDHNLDLAFNSLDAQREACEAYIKSQAHEGWKLVPDRFDDGAFSGASLIRPALQSLLEEVRARKIDIIVVYKVDRLTRSLADFAKLVELFDEHDVSFVSVTQSFNTTSSMGRLTLNVLLSFAQFEREVIGERVRDKIAASKRRGIWVGGPVPLGYRSVDKKLEVVPKDATLVRKIFADYLRLGSISELAASLEREGLKPRPRILSNGRTLEADRFMVGPLAHLLKNRFYIGEVVFQGEVHQGEHEAILDRDLFDAVQTRLAEASFQRRLSRTPSPAMLTGLIFDDRGNPMTPSHTNKKGVRYRYYVSHPLLQGQKSAAGSIARVSAPDVEAIAIASLREKLLPQDDLDDVALIKQHLKSVTVHRTKLDLKIRACLDQPETELTLSTPFAPSLLLRKGLVNPAQSQDPGTIDTATRETLLRAIARSRRWMDQILSGEIGSFEAIAADESLAVRHVRFLAPLAYLSPRIVSAINDGSAPASLTVSNLARALPHSWAEQERMHLRAAP